MSLIGMKTNMHIVSDNIKVPYLILNPVVVVRSDINSRLNLRNIKLIKWYNVARLCINLINRSTGKEKKSYR